MKEIKCPHCGKVFQVDETEYASILSQVKEEEVAKQVHVELEKQQALFNVSKLKEQNSLKEQYQNELNDLNKKINDLTLKLQSASKDKELALKESELKRSEALASKDQLIVKLE